MLLLVVFVVQQMIEGMERVDAVVVNVGTLRDIEFFSSLHDVFRQDIACYKVTDGMCT